MSWKDFAIVAAGFFVGYVYLGPVVSAKISGK